MPADTPPPGCSGRYVVPATLARSMGSVGSVECALDMTHNRCLRPCRHLALPIGLPVGVDPAWRRTRAARQVPCPVAVPSTTARRIHATHIELKSKPSRLSISLFDSSVRSPRCQRRRTCRRLALALSRVSAATRGRLSRAARDEEYRVTPASSRSPRQAPVRVSATEVGSGQPGTSHVGPPQIRAREPGVYQPGHAGRGSRDWPWRIRRPLLPRAFVAMIRLDHYRRIAVRRLFRLPG